MPLSGAVADRAKGIIPITWDALASDNRVGDGLLQGAIDVAKAATAGLVVAPTAEQNYPVIVVDQIAKLAVIEICNAGIDYWMNQSQSVSATGTNENISYVDRAAQLADLRKALVLETRERVSEIAKLVGFYQDNGRAVPLMSSATINPFHLTPSPEEFPRPYKQTQYS